jgi:hypothetical protein
VVGQLRCCHGFFMRASHNVLRDQGALHHWLFQHSTEGDQGAIAQGGGLPRPLAS